MRTRTVRFKSEELFPVVQSRFDPRWIRYTEPRARLAAVPSVDDMLSRSERASSTRGPQWSRQRTLELCIGAKTIEQIRFAAEAADSWLDDHPHDDSLRLVRDRLVARAYAHPAD